MSQDTRKGRDMGCGSQRRAARPGRLGPANAFSLLLFPLLAILLLPGCMAAVVPATGVVGAAVAVAPAGSTAYKVSREERGSGQMIEDMRIRATIIAEIMADESLSYLDMHTYSFAGRVFLLGEYQDRSQIPRLQAIAKGTLGVVSVTTYLFRKGESLCGKTDNLYLAGKVRAALIGTSEVRSTNIDVEVVQCNAILLGVVASDEEAGRVVEAARGVEGVLAVKSYLFSGQ